MWFLVFLTAYSTLADRYFNRGNFLAAERVYQHILKGHPHLIYSSPFIIKMGCTLLYLHRNRETLLYFKKALNWAQTSREKADASFWLGQAFFATGDYLKAEEYFNKSINYSRELPLDLLYSFGLSSYYQKKYKDAFNLFQNLYEQPQDRYPKNELSYLLGLCCLKMDNPQKAHSYLEDVSTPEGIYLLSLSEHLLDKNSLTVEILEKDHLDFPPLLRQKSLLLLSTAYVNLKDYDSALSKLSKAIEDTISYHKDYALFNIGLIHFNREEYKTASHFFEKFLEEFPKSSFEEQTLFLVAKSYMKCKEYDRSIASFKELLLLYPETQYREEALYNSAFSYFKNREYDKTNTEARNFLNIFGESEYRAETMCLIVRSLIKLRRDKEALRWGEKIVEEHPDTPSSQEALFLMGKIYLKEENFSLSRQSFHKIKRGKYYPKALKRIGDTYFKERRYYKAILFYKKALKENPPPFLLDNTRYHIELSYFKLGRYHSYSEFVHSFIKKYPDSKRVLSLQIQLGEYLYKRGEYNKVIEELQRLHNDEALWFTAKSYSSIEEDNLALSHYARLVNRFPKSSYSPQALLEMGKIYRRIGKLEETRVVLNRSLKKYPKSKFLKEAYLEMARSYKDESNWIKAEELLDISIQRFGPYAQAFLEKGEMARNRDKFSQAKDFFIRASDLFKKDRNQSALALLNAGECALALNNTKEARELFTQAGIITTDERIHLEVERRLSELNE